LGKQLFSKRAAGIFCLFEFSYVAENFQTTLNRKGNCRVPFQCEISKVSAKHKIGKMTLCDVSNCRVSLQYEPLNLNANQMVEIMILYT
jgi:hypothetical protein